ncbi:MAG: C4-dicarboxylate TRAP transporter substrate-binding protein [Sphaerochaetaceae bacterium]|jgi:TRAP-type C4-dicarboxylate transport system substrate-binding protein|nr:C4-dicarboxylate TRAP transporter substrate-binding protein [Spirochaetaceae bacterium]MDY6343346.1 C4-dicarboxylate TRAP transporter substrate-binding protein [Sphaerochaetaceae bacterium]
MKKLVAILSVAMAAMTFAFANGASESGAKSSGKTIELKVSTSQTEQAMISRSYQMFCDKLNEKAQGKIHATLYPAGQLGGDEDVIEQAIQGAPIAVNTDAARMGTYVHDMGIMMMGYFMDDYDMALKITQTATFKKWTDELASKHGIRVLAFDFYDGPRHFLTNKEIKTPADLKGLSIRTIGSPVCTESIAAMGATPIAMSWGEVYNGIQSKAIDGAEAQDTSTYPSKLYEVCKYMTKTGHFQLMQGLIVGESWFKTLPSDVQTLLVETAQEVGAETAKMVLDEAAKSEKLMADAGMVINEVDTAPFKAAVASAYDKLGYAELRKQIYAELGK